ncbi:SDR family NAD(P)-dependent oxidoreductase [Rosistilla ulvae]|uniref:SDR family NAD(P)-dependent oxidoreductase n=1 Tax=Rosistilla ulvae TaxID=1930277 RepID=UPI001FE5212C|nr:SDR family oxidoreductase [Rosistilla ulvae]
MPFDLTGSTALITGGTQGVGAAIAIAIAGSGGNVVLHGLRDDDAAQQTLAACRAQGANADLLLGDLAGPTEDCIGRLFDSATAAHPEINMLVNNAGTYIDVPFLEMDFERYQRTMQLNVAAGFFLTQAFARRWVDRQARGRVLFTGSINGQLAEPDHVAYDSSKGAVLAMVKSLCVALAPHGIRVNGMAPGLVKTPLTGVLETDQDLDAWMRLHTPNGRVPEASACGGAAVFLLSDEAEHVHGQMLLVDGGMSAWQQPDMPTQLRGKLS